VCESNAPLTSKTPIAGFEDRESHRTPFASAMWQPDRREQERVAGSPGFLQGKAWPNRNQMMNEEAVAVF
jgi:hypothetical protein